MDAFWTERTFVERAELFAFCDLVGYGPEFDDERFALAMHWISKGELKIDQPRHKPWWTLKPDKNFRQTIIAKWRAFGEMFGGRKKP